MQQKWPLKGMIGFIIGGFVATIIAIYILKTVFNAPAELLSIIKITLPATIVICAIIIGLKFRYQK